MPETEQIFIVVRIDIRTGIKDILGVYRSEHDAQNLVYKLDKLSRRKGDMRITHGVIVRDLLGDYDDIHRWD